MKPKTKRKRHRMKPCLGIPDYFVDKFGSVYSVKQGFMRRLKPQIRRDGYYRIGLQPGYKMKRVDRLIHKLVIEAFRGKRPNGLVIRHLNGNSLDNRIQNLTYGSCADNVKDTVRLKRHNHADNHPMRKISSDDVRDIKKMLIDGVSMADVARKFGVSHGCVSDIFHKRTWVTIKP